MTANYQLRNSVTLRFSNFVKRRITKLGLAMDSVCEQEVEKMLMVGVTRLEHQRALAKEEMLLVAEENLWRVLNDLNERSQILGTYPVMDGEAFASMKKRLSPLWPFL